MPEIESVDKRARRAKRMQNDLARFQHALRFFGTYEALSHTVGFRAVWDAVRRVATDLIGWWVADVGTAWGIVGYVNKLPDGAERLKMATDVAVQRWQDEIVALLPAEQVSA